MDFRRIFILIFFLFISASCFAQDGFIKVEFTCEGTTGNGIRIVFNGNSEDFLPEGTIKSFQLSFSNTDYVSGIHFEPIGTGASIKSMTWSEYAPDESISYIRDTNGYVIAVYTNEGVTFHVRDGAGNVIATYRKEATGL